MKTSIPFSLALTFLLTACSAPLVTLNTPVFQAKVTHVNDWHALAERMANNFAASHSRNTPVFVAPGPPDMPFAAAFRNELEQSLLHRGYWIAETGSGEAVVDASDQLLLTQSQATVLRFDVQAFLYRNSDRKPVPLWTVLGAGYAVGTQLRHVTSIDTGAAIAGASGPVLDILSSLYDTTKAEVLLNLSVYRGTHLEYRDLQTFYVHPSEFNFYLTGVPDFTPQAKNQPVTEVSLPVR